MPRPHRRRDGSPDRGRGRAAHHLRHGESRGPRHGHSRPAAGGKARRQIWALSSRHGKIKIMNPLRRLTAMAVVAFTAGLMLPLRALAAWNKEAFGAKTASDALKGLGAAGSTQSKDITIEAPQVAE